MNKYYKQLEQTRLISYTIASTVKTKRKLPTISKWMPLPTDKQISSISDKRALEIFKQLQKNG